jgi:hypothetical protein
MGLLRGSRAAAVGKRRANKTSPPSDAHVAARRLILALVALLAVNLFGSASYAQSGGPFAGMAGNWSGGGTVTLDDGSSERLRCRSSYAVGAGGNGLNLSLLCASDSYRFDLRSDVISDRGALSGSWSESSRGINGNLEGRGANGNFQVTASAPGFTANIALATRGARQSISITSQSAFRSASIALSRH